MTALRTDNPADDRRQLLERGALFGEELVPVVNAAHAAHDVPKASLGMIRRHLGAAHEAAGGARARWLFQPKTSQALPAPSLETCRSQSIEGLRHAS